MITDEMIMDALVDVDEEELETYLCELECFHTSLAKAIVCFAANEGDIRNVSSALNACYAAVRNRQQELAQKIAQDKEDASRFSARMADDDWDDWSRRMTA